MLASNAALGALAIGSWILYSLPAYIRYHKRSKLRKNIHFDELPTQFGRWISGLRYLWCGPILQGSFYNDRKVFAIPTPETYYMHVSSTTHIQEMIWAPETDLSLHALSKNLFKPEYTMNGLHVADDGKANGNVHSYALQGYLTQNLDKLRPALVACIRSAMKGELERQELDSSGRIRLHVYPFVKKLIVAGNCLTFFGEQVTNDIAFLKAALDFPDHLMQTAEVVRFIPSWLAPVLAPVLMQNYRSLSTLVDRLTLLIRSRVESSKETTNQVSTETPNLIRSFVDISARKAEPWTAHRILQVLIGIFFAAVHQPALTLTYALENIYSHARYITHLRQEIADAASEGAAIQDLPLLDAFFKESARVNPPDSISVRRKVLRPFCFSDGTQCQPGDVLCVPTQSILRSPEHYPKPDIFDISRHVVRQQQQQEVSPRPGSLFTESTPQFPFWGLGRRAWHYASFLMKIIFAQVLMDYDVELPPGQLSEKRRFFWRSNMIPKESAVIFLSPRHSNVPTTQSTIIA